MSFPTTLDEVPTHSRIVVQNDGTAFKFLAAVYVIGDKMYNDAWLDYGHGWVTCTGVRSQTIDKEGASASVVEEAFRKLFERLEKGDEDTPRNDRWMVDITWASLEPIVSSIKENVDFRGLTQ